MSNTTDLKSFNYLESGRVTFSMLDTIKTVKKLDKGLYSIYKTATFSNPEIVLTKETPTEIHDLIRYHFIDKMDEIFNKFFDKEIKDKVSTLNYKHKVGLILFGKQGTAKSSILKHYYLRGIEEHNALVFFFSNQYALPELWDFITKIRKIQDNPIIIFLDEFDEFFKRESYEDTFKMIMDGHLSIDNCMFLAATNYIDNIPKTIVDRPSRFKHSIEVEGIQDENMIFDFLNSNLSKLSDNVDEKELKRLAKESIGKTVDEIKEIILDKVMEIETEKKSKNKIGFTK